MSFYPDITCDLLSCTISRSVRFVPVCGLSVLCFFSSHLFPLKPQPGTADGRTFLSLVLLEVSFC